MQIAIAGKIAETAGSDPTYGLKVVTLNKIVAMILTEAGIPGRIFHVIYPLQNKIFSEEKYSK